MLIRSWPLKQVCKLEPPSTDANVVTNKFSTEKSIANRSLCTGYLEYTIMFWTKMTDTQAPPRTEPSETRLPREASDTSISVSRGLWSMHFIYNL